MRLPRRLLLQWVRKGKPQVAWCSEPFNDKFYSHYPLLMRCPHEDLLESVPTMNDQESLSKSTKDSLAWEILKLLLVPAVLAFFGVWLNENSAKRDRMQSYLTTTTELATKTASDEKNEKLGDNPALRSLVRLRTLLLLSEIDPKSKRHVVEFLANSDVHYQISLERADLSGADLSGLYLRDVDLRRANLKGVNLNGTDLRGATLKDAQVNKYTTLKSVKTDECTILPGSAELMFSKESKNCRSWRMN